ncbi:MAG TPA: T9SS type A sorting domain-containing protein, partial [Vicingus sp.]|nr:T9SS type A sorting domain-containing protein [Vicingus sp.]
LESEQAKWLEIMSIDGKTVFSQHINQSKTAINTNLPQGLYFAKITFENNKQTIQKLVITD